MKKRIEKLKKEKNAVILAHYYVPGEVQEIADYVGDSFYLAKVAKECEADRIVFCGVQFMGESAKILNPDKKILLPNLKADCPMAHMVRDGVIEEMRKSYEDLAVVCYINSTAELKTKCDVCVTSSNAVKVIRSLPNKNIFFVPDRHLGSFVAQQVPQKNMILNDGCCPIHAKIYAEQIEDLKEKHPCAMVLTHPESDEKVVEISEFVGSTSEIIDFAKKSEKNEFIICTEVGVAHRLMTDNPNKKFYFPNPDPCCVDMKLNTLKSVLEVLEKEHNEVIVDEEVRKKALLPLEKMLELGK